MEDGFLWIQSGTFKAGVYSAYLMVLVMGLLEEVVYKYGWWKNFFPFP